MLRRTVEDQLEKKLVKSFSSATRSTLKKSKCRCSMKTLAGKRHYLEKLASWKNGAGEAFQVGHGVSKACYLQGDYRSGTGSKGASGQAGFPYPQHILLYGPPGVGKTTAARLALEEAKKRRAHPYHCDSPFIGLTAPPCAGIPGGNQPAFGFRA